MQVKVANKMYRMSQKEYDGLLQVASEQVSLGIYAVEKKDYAEFRCDRCKSITQLKELTRRFKAQGFKVHANKGEALGSADSVAMKEGLLSAT